MEFFDFKKFFDWSRLLDPNPGSQWQFLNWILGICIGLIILALIRRFWPGDRTLKVKTQAMLWTIGLLGLLLIFFRWQSIPYFSARIVWLGLIIWAIIWLIFLIYYRQIILPKKILQLKVEERKKKYFH